MTDPRYSVLFEPVQIGPVTAPNRFYQVPHCNGLGHRHPQAEAANRGIKAAGGWGVVCTQEVEIHPSSEISPYAEGRLWDADDIPAMALMTSAVHEHGALAGIELVYSGHHAPNRYSRSPPMAPSALPVHGYEPLQARAMTRQDIRNLRHWYVQAARRAREAGFDIVYVYAGHDMSVLQHFLTPRSNQRCDEYGGSLENRVRLLNETLMDVKEAVGDRCGIALRLAVDERMGEHGIEATEEGRAIVELLADLPDLWDVNISDWSNDSATARFEPAEGYQEPYTAFVKSVTGKPVVGVGRFTSPDAMVSQIRRGVLDLIGAARPSIADPFLPVKIREDRIDEIRECIGCNICVSSDNVIAPIRCTQNPTMGEEWKRNWHPERIERATSDARTLVVGSGPAGLECALQLARRGYHVTLAESSEELGGRSLAESRLPGLQSYVRVRDYRVQQLQKMVNVDIFRGHELTVDDVVDLEIPNVFIATGARWRRDAAGRKHPLGWLWPDSMPRLMTPDDLLAGVNVSGRVVVYDDDHYYLGGVLAEHLALMGNDVSLVTPAELVSAWTMQTLEQHKIQQRLVACGVRLLTQATLDRVEAEQLRFRLATQAEPVVLPSDVFCVVTSRLPVDQLWNELMAHQSDHPDWPGCVVAVGDCYAPSTIAAAVYAGHLAARQFESGVKGDPLLFRRELPVASGPST